MSRFVAAGGAEPTAPSDGSKEAAREDAWAQAQKQLEAMRAKSKPQAGKQEDGKSLYEVLQANKAAKQADFEEQAKLKNQFRALDDDEVDYLDSLNQSSRAKENAVRKQTAEELEAFRKQQQQAEKSSASEEQSHADVAAADTWRTKKRRKRDTDTAISKLRKTNTESNTSPPPAADVASVTSNTKTASPTKEEETSAARITPNSGLGLAYDSDDD
ncbi:uncharacterized protein HMPREF1541_08690 [Cyphellophora europaea CBS 101466]|uniref:FAM192A/Fyv6 N-terminal domain-containing protein n=1 Tax=Cyphellophora europaea (strain CBS 101466) TaxID=1220924 RepID=W2RL43_CYPE1|nr:uncharacterized protein HMPREF1541_08690 [Cyphellophora europaea CBS 101466]ETN36413.1 hypothetical protein HMPREF1541_08690 [Cyphellophora europaea CBS 101466]